MDILRRESAQLSDRVWKELDEAAASAAKNVMTARRVATFDGPAAGTTSRRRSGR
jgi:uncharacterized linocin/CFP29 family protein